MSDQYDLNWFGELTVDNLSNVVELFRQLLDEKTYTFVSVNADQGAPPNVRTDQRVEHKKATSDNAFSSWIEDGTDDPSYGGLNVVDTYGVWGLSVSQNTKTNPHVSFSPDMVKIKLYNALGEKLYWVIAIQKGK